MDRSSPSSPNVLGIAGSPRREGNSELLLDACLEGVRDAGGSARKIVVADLRIEPCRGCNECSTTGECVIDDDMAAIYPVLDASDAIVVATPVFFATVPSTLKAFYDRCQPYWARRYVMKQPAPETKRPGVLLVVRAGGDPFGHECAETTTKSVFAVLGVALSDEIVVEGVDAAGDVVGHPEALTWARGKGASLVS